MWLRLCSVTLNASVSVLAPGAGTAAVNGSGQATLASSGQPRRRHRAPLPANGVHGAQRLEEAGGVDLVPLPLGPHAATDDVSDGAVRSLAAQQALDIDLIEGE